MSQGTGEKVLKSDPKVMMVSEMVNDVKKNFFFSCCEIESLTSLDYNHSFDCSFNLPKYKVLLMDKKDLIVSCRLEHFVLIHPESYLYIYASVHTVCTLVYT